MSDLQDDYDLLVDALEVAQKRIAELETENAALYSDRIANLEAERDLLSAALIKYGIHIGDCMALHPVADNACTCGLDAALGKEQTMSDPSLPPDPCRGKSATRASLAIPCDLCHTSPCRCETYLVRADEMEAWGQSDGCYLNRADVRRLIATVRSRERQRDSLRHALEAISVALAGSGPFGHPQYDPLPEINRIVNEALGKAVS